MSNIDNSQMEKPSPILMLVLFGLGIVCFFILLYNFSGVATLGVILIFIAAFGFLYKYKEDCRDYDDYIRQQKQSLRAINEIVKDTNRCFQNIYINQREAGNALRKAQKNFNRPAYNSFWDQIEKAALELVRFSQNLADLSSYLERYSRAITHYHGVAKPFPVTSEKFNRLYRLGRENALAKDMARLLDKADESYKFASIYQQRKTNKTLARTNEILETGFKDLADVLEGVGDQITDHIADLNVTVQDYNREMAVLMEDAAAQRQQHHDELMEADSQRAEREEEQLEIIDSRLPRKKRKPTRRRK